MLVNDDPYYFSVQIASLNTVKIRNTPRIFIIDTDRDHYPDIVTADISQNNVGILFNHGKQYWKNIFNYYRQQNADRLSVYIDKQWNYIPLYEPYQEKLFNKEIKDFTIFKTSSKKRINFEIFTVYDRSLYWFVEKDLNLDNFADYGSHRTEQNYLYCTKKCDIVLDKDDYNNTTMNDYYMLVDIDVNGDTFPEFIVYSSKQSNLYWIKKHEAYITGFGWNSSFWIYMIIYIYVVSSVIGFVEFYKLNKLHRRISSQKQILSLNSLGDTNSKHNLTINN